MGTEAGMEMMQKQNRKKILIIDDDVKIGNLEQEVLEQEGYCCQRAYSGKEALLCLEHTRPDLVLLGGAQDNITKPFSTKELLARVEVQLRKAVFQLSDSFRYKDLIMDTASRAVTVAETILNLCGGKLKVVEQEYKNEYLRMYY